MSPNIQSSFQINELSVDFAFEVDMIAIANSCKYVLYNLIAIFVDQDNVIFEL